MNIIENKKIFFIASGTLILASILAILVWGFKPGIDLAGGTLWQFQFKNDAINESQIRDFFGKVGVTGVVINKEIEGKSFIVRSNLVEEGKHQEYLTLLKKEFGDIEELRFESIGPAIGRELKIKSFWAIGLVIFGISLYVAFAFRAVSRPVSSFRYGLITVLTLFHDVIIPAGVMSVLTRFSYQELDTNFIVALLVIMGFSVHDTIVVFDRIRENLRKSEEKRGGLVSPGQYKDFGVIVNKSINETMPRSINTSLTLVLVLLVLFIAGPLVLKNFVLMILIGTVVGTYSSIFIASPFLVFWHKKR